MVRHGDISCERLTGCELRAIGHLQHRTTPSGHTTWMNLAVKIPSALLDQADLSLHALGRERARDLELGITNNTEYMRMQLYGKYAYALANMLQMPVCFLAQQRGFAPVILFRNFLTQANKYEGGFDIRTVDKGAKSSFVLLGFVREVNERTDWLSLEHRTGGFAIPSMLKNL